MNPTQKRSSGGYSLRRKIVKKRWDDDFEYYFSKIGSLDKPDTEQENYKDETQIVLLADSAKSCSKTGTRNGRMLEKRPRGRPRKVSAKNERQRGESSDQQTKLFSYANGGFQQNCKDEVMPLSSVGGGICSEKSLGKLEDILSPVEITCLQEEVSSAPVVGKENLPEDSVHLESEHETMVVQMTGESGELDDIEDLEKRLISPKLKRRYRRNNVSEEAIEKLSQLSPSDKMECTECHKLLKPSSYRQHLRTHSGAKPFGCDMCDARFTRKGDVERHVRIVHDKQKPYKCSKCHRSYGDKKNLRWHLMNHDKRLFYVCEVCGFKFGKREYWENHVRIIHPVDGLRIQKCDGSSGEEEEEEEERIYAFTDRFLTDNEASVDDPDEDGLEGESVPSYSPNRQLNCATGEATVVAEICVGNEKKDVKVDDLATNLVSIAEGNKSSFISGDQLPDEDGMGTVVIQLDGSEKNKKFLKSTQHVLQNNVFEISPSDVLRLEQDAAGDHHFELNSQTYENNGGDVVEVSVGQEGVRSVEYVRKTNSKVYNITLTEEQAKKSSVQSLVEALLTVVRTDDQNVDVLETT